MIAGLGLGGWEGLEEWFWGSGSRLDSLQLMVCGVGVPPMVPNHHKRPKQKKTPNAEA